MRQRVRLLTGVLAGFVFSAVMLGLTAVAGAQSRGYESVSTAPGSAGGGGDPTASAPSGLPFTGWDLEAALAIGLGLIAVGVVLSQVRGTRSSHR